MDQIAAVLAGGGATTAELAEKVGTPERAVSFALFACHGRFRSDRGSPARWCLASVPQVEVPAWMAPEPALSVSPVDHLGLYPWQLDALDTWRRCGHRGVVEAVTGTGKTMVGVAAALAELGRGGQVLVLVPSGELQYQWVAELRDRLPARWRVGLLGAGGADTLATSDVLVAVVNTARAADVRPIRTGGLLVADECHRYGSAVNQLALDSRFRRRLGLSAAYARDDEGNLAWLDPYFGGTCFRLGYDRAISEGITASFTVTLIGVAFRPPEQTRYDELTELMGRLQARLIGQFGIPAVPFEAFLRRAMSLADGEAEGCRV
ncbi:MAG: DEAD/DEAH box helicase, partial [Acidimicrobiales bacterium]